MIWKIWILITTRIFPIISKIIRKYRNFDIPFLWFNYEKSLNNIVNFYEKIIFSFDFEIDFASK